VKPEIKDALTSDTRLLGVRWEEGQLVLSLDSPVCGVASLYVAVPPCTSMQRTALRAAADTEP